MCIVFYTLAQPGYKLVLAANRDEFLDRPASDAAWHNFDADGTDDNWVLCGRDLGSPDKGTWMGITKDLRIGTLTNIRYPIVPPPPDAHSRGLFLKDYLAPPPDKRPNLDEYMLSLTPEAYTGFNLLLFDLSKADPEVGYLSNRTTPAYMHPELAGCHGMSNSPWAEPYPKVVDGQVRMKATLEEWTKQGGDEDDLIERMVTLLSPAPVVHDTQDLTSATRVMPIVIPQAEVSETTGNPRWYGTRISSVILVKDNGQVTFIERDRSVLDSDGHVQPGVQSKERRFQFQAILS